MTTLIMIVILFGLWLGSGYWGISAVARYNMNAGAPFSTSFKLLYLFFTLMGPLTFLESIGRLIEYNGGRFFLHPLWNWPFWDSKTQKGDIDG